MQVESKSQIKCVYFSLNCPTSCYAIPVYWHALTEKGGKLDIKFL